MRSLTLSAKLVGASLAVMATASVSIGTANAAPVDLQAGKQDSTQQATAKKSDTVSSNSLLSAKAKAAGQAKFGQDATDQQSLNAYWTAARMASATPAEEDKALEASAKKYVADQKAL